jgi:hypothetical protein
MESLGVGHLLSYIRVAFRAQGSIRPAKGCMTPIASRFEIRMRGIAGDWTAQRVFRAERTRAEGHSTEKHNHPGQSKEQCQDNVNADEPSQSFHAPSLRATDAEQFIL